MGMSKSDSSSRLYHGSPYLSKLESISSAAVRAADKVGASLIVVYTHTGDRQGGVHLRGGGGVLPQLLLSYIKLSLHGNVMVCLKTAGH
jgi:hypothetical protein